MSRRVGGQGVVIHADRHCEPHCWMDACFIAETLEWTKRLALCCFRTEPAGVGTALPFPLLILGLPLSPNLKVKQSSKENSPEKHSYGRERFWSLRRSVHVVDSIDFGGSRLEETQSLYLMPKKCALFSPFSTPMNVSYVGIFCDQTG